MGHVSIQVVNPVCKIATVEKELKWYQKTMFERLPRKSKLPEPFNFSMRMQLSEEAKESLRKQMEDWVGKPNLILTHDPANEKPDAMDAAAMSLAGYPIASGGLGKSLWGHALVKRSPIGSYISHESKEDKIKLNLEKLPPIDSELLKKYASDFNAFSQELFGLPAKVEIDKTAF